MRLSQLIDPMVSYFVQAFDARQRELHRGFAPESSINAGLNTMLSALNKENNSLIHALISHFMYESVNPFYDGNGRSGRYFLAVALQRVLSVTTALSLSRTIQLEKNKYYKAFSEVEHVLNRGDGTPFLLILLALIAQAQEDTYDDLRWRQDALVEL